MNTLESPTTAKTLRQRLDEGHIPVHDGLRYAALLAEALRKLHDEGKAHGAVTPDAIVLTATGLDLLPAEPAMVPITPYTAPEVAAERKPADARSDIFSFGAVVFEILTGRQAFDGETEPAGSPGVDRLLSGCLAKDPAARWRRIQRVQLELKLLAAADQRSSTPPAAVRTAVSDAALHAELEQFEARINAKLLAHENVVADIQRAASEALTTLREQLSDLHTHVAADMHEFELTLKAQSSAIDSARTAMAQTDDLVERVVEALESLQSTVLEQSEERVLALN